MKQKDIALILVVVFISAIVSFFLSSFLFASPANRQQKAEVVQAITANFSSPSSKYFNGNSIDPTQLIQIGNNNNTNPFSGTGQQ